jgi:hypothetical protein
MIKKKDGVPNFMKMDDTTKRQETKENVENINMDIRSKDEDYNIEVGKFNFHCRIHVFNMLPR